MNMDFIHLHIMFLYWIKEVLNDDIDIMEDFLKGFSWSIFLIYFELWFFFPIKSFF
jgi:hypothetical protein